MYGFVGRTIPFSSGLTNPGRNFHRLTKKKNPLHTEVFPSVAQVLIRRRESERVGCGFEIADRVGHHEVRHVIGRCREFRDDERVRAYGDGSGTFDGYGATGSVLSEFHLCRGRHGRSAQGHYVVSGSRFA